MSTLAARSWLGHARSVLALAVGALLMAVVIGCGGSGDGDLAELLEAADDAGLAADDGDRLSLPGLSVSGDDNAVEVEFGDASTSLGEDLDRPDWLDPFVRLPDGIALSLAIDDPSTGERYLQGIVEGGDAAAIAAQARAMMEAAGYEALQDSGFFVADGRPSVRIQIGDTGSGSVGYVYEHVFEDAQTLRDLHAPVEGFGTLTVWFQGQVLQFAGQCTVRSESGQFSSGDGQANLTVERRAGEQDYLLGNFFDVDGLWTIAQVGPNGEQPAVSLREAGFQFDGYVVDALFENPTFATIEVVCG